MSSKWIVIDLVFLQYNAGKVLPVRRNSGTYAYRAAPRAMPTARTPTSDRLLVAGMQSKRAKLAADLFTDELLEGTFAQRPRAVIALDGFDRLLRQRDS